jgi:hypothetical protein
MARAAGTFAEISSRGVTALAKTGTNMNKDNLNNIAAET